MNDRGRRFHDAVVVVTGAASGLGLRLCERFGAEGAKVAAIDVDGPGLDRAYRELTGKGIACLPRVADLRDPRQIDDAAAAVESELGHPSVLVNNAMGCQGDDFRTMPIDTWFDDFAVTLHGSFLCARAFVNKMIPDHGGSIVHVSSVNGYQFLGNDAYSAAKAGLASLSRSIAVRYGHLGVRSNCVVVGSMRTPVWDKRIAEDPEILEKLSRWYPAGRIGTTDDVANAVMFLASSEAAWITGSELRVDGGLLSGMKPLVEEMMVEKYTDEM